MSAAGPSWPELFSDWRPLKPLRPGSADAFVPPSPVAAWVGRYEGPAFHPGQYRGGRRDTMRLVRTGPVSSTELGELVADLNAAKRGVMRCPFNPWVVVVARFRYREGPDVEAWIGIAGCRNAGNGARDAIVSRVRLPQVVAD